MSDRTPEQIADELAAKYFRGSAIERQEANGHAFDPDVPPVNGPEDFGLPPGDAEAGRAGESESNFIQSSAEFIAGFTPPDYLVDGILQRRFIYSMTGRTGSGKTAIVLLIAASVELGRSIGAHEVQRGRVLYLAGENPDDIRMRWIAMAPHLGFDAAQVDVHFIPGTFKISEMFKRIEQEAEKVGPFALVIVDTSAAYFEGDEENSNAQQGLHARRLRSLVNLSGGPTVIVAAHPPKNAGEENLQPRGGGAFIAEMDGNLTVAKDEGLAELHWQGKFRGPDFAPLSFQLRGVTHENLKDSRGRLIPTVMAAYLSEAAQDDIAAATRASENRVLAAYADSPDPSLAAVARSLGWTMRTGEPDKSKVRRAVSKLEKAKLVTLERGKPTLTDKGKKAFAAATAKSENGRYSTDRSTATAGRYESEETQ
jgi:DNA-binding MarR family transcriptional regulator